MKGIRNAGTRRSSARPDFVAAPGKAIHQLPLASLNVWPVLSACKAWLDRLPEDTKLEPVAVTADGHDLAGVRNRIKAANAELDALRRAPAPSDDIEARVRNYVRGLAPKVRGVGVGERLSIVWPGAQTASQFISEHTCDPLSHHRAVAPSGLPVLWARSVRVAAAVVRAGHLPRPQPPAELAEVRT